MVYFLFKRVDLVKERLVKELLVIGVVKEIVRKISDYRMKIDLNLSVDFSFQIVNELLNNID